MALQNTRKRVRRKACSFCAEKVKFIDYKDVKLLKHTLSERFKIMPRRLTGNSKSAQDMVGLAIKRARHMALIPYIVDRKNPVVGSLQD